MRTLAELVASSTLTSSDPSSRMSTNRSFPFESRTNLLAVLPFKITSSNRGASSIIFDTVDWRGSVIRRCFSWSHSTLPMIWNSPLVMLSFSTDRRELSYLDRDYNTVMSRIMNQINPDPLKMNRFEVTLKISRAREKVRLSAERGKERKTWESRYECKKTETGSSGILTSL